MTVKGLSEDLDAGEPSVANCGAGAFRREGPGGFVPDLQLPGSQAERLVRPLVEGSVEYETQADTARRYLRDHAARMAGFIDSLAPGQF